MRKIMSASVLAAFALTILLPGTRQVNATSVNHQVLRQGGNPIPSGGGVVISRAAIRSRPVVAGTFRVATRFHPVAVVISKAVIRFRPVVAGTRHRYIESGQSPLAGKCYPASEVIMVQYKSLIRTHEPPGKFSLMVYAIV